MLDRLDILFNLNLALARDHRTRTCRAKRRNQDKRPMNDVVGDSVNTDGGRPVGTEQGDVFTRIRMIAKTDWTWRLYTDGDNCQDVVTGGLSGQVKE